MLIYPMAYEELVVLSIALKPEEVDILLISLRSLKLAIAFSSTLFVLANEEPGGSFKENITNPLSSSGIKEEGVNCIAKNPIRDMTVNPTKAILLFLINSIMDLIYR